MQVIDPETGSLTREAIDRITEWFHKKESMLLCCVEPSVVIYDKPRTIGAGGGNYNGGPSSGYVVLVGCMNCGHVYLYDPAVIFPDV